MRLMNDVVDEEQTVNVLLWSLVVLAVVRACDVCCQRSIADSSSKDSLYLFIKRKASSVSVLYYSNDEMRCIGLFIKSWKWRAMRDARARQN